MKSRPQPSKASGENPPPASKEGQDEKEPHEPPDHAPPNGRQRTANKKRKASSTKGQASDQKEKKQAKTVARKTKTTDQNNEKPRKSPKSSTKQKASPKKAAPKAFDPPSTGKKRAKAKNSAAEETEVEIPDEESFDRSPIPVSDLPYREQCAFISLLQVIDQFYRRFSHIPSEAADLFFVPQFDKLKKLIEDNLEAYPRLACAILTFDPTAAHNSSPREWGELAQTWAESSLLSALAVTSKGLSQERQLHSIMKMLIEQTPRRLLEKTFVPIEGAIVPSFESVRDIISMHHQSLIPWICKEYRTLYYEKKFSVGDLVALRLDDSDVFATIEEVESQGWIKIKNVADGKTSLASPWHITVRVIETSSSDDDTVMPSKVTDIEESLLRTQVEGKDDICLANMSRNDYLSLQLPCLPDDKLSNDANDSWSVLLECIRNMFHLRGAVHSPQRLLRRTKTALRAHPELTQVVGLGLFGFSILGALCQHSGGVEGIEEAPYECIKYLILKNPCALLWEIDEAEEEDEAQALYQTLELIARDHPQIFFWISKEFPWIWDHPLVHVPMIMRTIFLKYFEGLVSAGELKQLFMDNRFLLDRFIYGIHGEPCYPVQFCLLKLMPPAAEPNKADAELVKWMVQLHSEYLTKQKNPFVPYTPSTLFMLFHIIRAPNPFLPLEDRIGRFLPHWKFLMKNNPQLTQGVEWRGFRDDIQCNVVQTMVSLIRRTRGRLNLEALVRIEIQSLKRDSNLLQESTRGENSSQLLEDVDQIFSSWKDSRVRELRQVRYRCRRQMHNDIDKLGINHASSRDS